jgi:hypothetical protein
VLHEATAKFNSVGYPSTSNENGVRSWVGERRKAHRVILQLNERARSAFFAAQDARGVYETAYAALKAQLNALSEEGVSVVCAGEAFDPAADVVVNAAKKLVFPRLNITTPDAPRDHTTVEPLLTPVLTEALDKLRTTNVRALCIAAEANARVDEIKAAAKALSDSQTVKVQEPVRPVPEEIQRYLSQLEMFMLNRQLAHRAWKRAQTLREELQKKLKAVDEEINNLNVLLLSSSDLWHGSVQTEKEIASTAKRWIAAILEDLDIYAPPVALDLSHRTKATAAEQRKIARLRELMVSLATNMAHLNEATESHKAACESPKHTVSRAGIVTTGSWQECLKWREQIQVEQDAADVANFSRQTKIDLLAESIAHYKSRKKETAKTLHRYLVFAMPAPSKPPCDEMRAVMNACAHMYWFRVGGQDDEDNLRTREGQYPVY